MEILIVILLCLAIFLLLERMNIRQSLYAWLVTLAEDIVRLLASVSQDLARFVRRTALSDLIAYLLLLVVVGLVIWRIRHRLLTLPKFSDAQCPRCGGELTRIHRRWLDRMLNLFVPLRRYRCKNNECTWQGLRVHRSERSIHASHGE